MSVVSVNSLFESSKEKVWEAITNPELMKIWYFDISNFKLEIGNKFSFYETGGTSYLHECEMLDFEENRSLKHTWTHPNQSKGSSILTWNIEEVEPNKVKVSLMHDGLETFADAGPNFTPANYEMGWNALLKTSLRNYLYNIQKLVFTVEIKATVSGVWNTMWNKEDYTKWCNPFCEGTYFAGEIEANNRIHFLTPDGQGMYADVFYLIPEKMVLFKHIGVITDFKEQPLDAETEKWTGCIETYKLNEKEGVTTVTVEVDTMEQYIDHMNNMFPLALQELKKIVENKQV